MNSRSFVLGLALALASTLTAVYWNHFDNGFHFDDHHTIVTNAAVKDIHNIPLFFKDAQTTSSLPLNQAYRPMITMLNALDYWMTDSLNPKAFHWHIFLEFLLLLILLYAVFLHLFELASGKKLYLLALLGTAFFAFHTATAETINYIIARSDGFSTLMLLASLLIYLKSEGWKRQLALIPFIIGCLAKPTTLMLAPILFMFELLLQRPSLFVTDERAKFLAKTWSSLRRTLPFFVVGLAMYFFTRSMFSETWKPSNVDRFDYLNTQPYICWIYLKTFFLPNELTADSDLTLIKEMLSAKVLWGLLVISVSLFVAWYSSRIRKTLPITFGILWFYVALIPSSSVIPLAEVMNHHRTFFPYIGLVLAVVWAVYLLVEMGLNGRSAKLVKALVAASVVSVLGAHAYGTYQRNEVWHDDASLWKDVTIKSPKNGRGLMNYGITEMNKQNLESAIHYFDKTLQSNYRNHPYAYINMAIAKNALGRQNKDNSLIQEAERFYLLGIQMGPSYPDCHYHYAKWLYANGRIDEAIGHLNKAIELSPAHEPAKTFLDGVLASTAQQTDRLEEKAEQTNTPEAYLTLSLRLYHLGRFEDCIKACEKAIQLKPDYAEAYNNICSAYNKLNRFDDAIAACEKALKIAPEYPLAKGNLSWAKRQKETSQ